MADQASPLPYNCMLNGEGYLKPPPDVITFTRYFGGWFVRKSMPWFPDREQTAGVKESQLPPTVELSRTVNDRSGGFGWSDFPDSAVDSGPGVYAYTDQVDIGIAGDGQGVDCSVAGMTFLAPFLTKASVPAGTADLSGHFELTLAGTRYVFVVMGTQLYQSTDAQTWVTTIPGSGTQMPVLPAPLTGRPFVLQGVQAAPLVYFPMGASTVALSWDGAAATMTALTTSDENKLIDGLVVDTFAWGLWYDTTSKRYRLAKFDDGGTNPSWFPSYDVSDGSDPAQVVLYAAGKLFIGCTRRLVQIADDLASLKETILEAPYDVNNFRWWTAWENELWFNTLSGTYRLLITTGAVTLDQVGPENLPNNRTPINGLIHAKAGDNFCLYNFIQNNDGYTYLLKYRYYDNKARASFHSLERVGHYTVNYAFVTKVTANPKLVFGLSSTSLASIVLPRNGFYPPADANCTFCTKGRLYESRQYGDMVFVPKVLLAVTPRAQDTSATETIDISYRTGAGDSFIQWSASSQVYADPGRRLVIDSPVSCSWWEHALTFQRGGTATKTPKLLAFTTHHNLRPVARGYFTMYLWITDYADTRLGLHDYRSAADIQNALLALDSSTLPMTLVDDLGNSYQVMVDTVKIDAVFLGADESYEKVAEVTAFEWEAVPRGSHDAAANYTHAQLAAYTHDQIPKVVS